MGQMKRRRDAIQRKPYMPLAELKIEGVDDSQHSRIETKPPKVQMIDKHKLVIDQRYQRQLSPDSVRLINHIATHFDWMHFQPLLVAPIPRGKFSVIDGKHRGVAVMHRDDIEKVPCAILEIPSEDQAFVFSEINSRLLKINQIDLFWSRYHSGESDHEQSIFAALDKHDIMIARREPTTEEKRLHTDQNDIFKGQIWDMGAVNWCAKTYGPELMAQSVKFVHDWESKDYRAMNGFPVRAVCKFFYDNNIFQPYDGAAEEFKSHMSWAKLWDLIKRRNITKREVNRPEQIMTEALKKYYFTGEN